MDRNNSSDRLRLNVIERVAPLLVPMSIVEVQRDSTWGRIQGFNIYNFHRQFPCLQDYKVLEHYTLNGHGIFTIGRSKTADGMTYQTVRFKN